MDFLFSLLLTSLIFFATRIHSFFASAPGSHDPYIDLSYSLGNNTIFYPGTRGYALSRDQEGYRDGGEFWYSAFSFCMGEHGGTHIDAPYHFHKGGWTVDQIPPTHLINVPAVMISVEPELLKMNEGNAGDFKLRVEHLVEFERARGQQIPFEGVLLVYTGWSKYWPDRNKYLGIENTTDGSVKLRFPGISENAIKWLVEERQIVGIGIDTPSVDQGADEHYPVHVYASSKQLYNLENVANLHLLPPGIKLRLFVLPLKIIGGTGAPARILASVSD